MSSRIVSVRLPASLAEELAVFCAAWAQCPSGVMRAAVRYMLGQPGLHPDLCDRPAPPLTVDFRTHEQQQAWERYQRYIDTFSMADIVTERHLA